MKTVIDILDVVILLVVLGLMLPNLIGAMHPLIDAESYGFYASDDKSMKLYNGDTFLDITSNDKITVAEILLMIETAGKDDIKYNGLILPNGQYLIINENFEINKNTYVNTIKNSLDKSKFYKLKLDYDLGIWQIY